MKKLTALLALVLTFALSLSIGIMASASTTEGTPFSTVTGNPSSLGSATVTGGEQGPWDVTLDSSYDYPASRLYYGEDNAPYLVDLRNFSMKFTITELADSASFRIGFLQSHDDFPIKDYGTGIGVTFNHIDKSLQPIANKLPEDELLSSFWLVYENNDDPGARTSFIGHEIVWTITERDGQLYSLMTFTDPTEKTVNWEAGINYAWNFDHSRAVLFFNLVDGKGSDMKFTINEIKGIRASDATDPVLPEKPTVSIDYTLDQSAPFMTWGDFVGNVDVKKNAETGYSDIVTRASKSSMTRVWYGETDGTNNNIYSVDITNFTMKFDIDQIASGQALTLAFMSSYNDYPLGTYGTGLSLVFKDSQETGWGHEENCGYYVNVNKFSNTEGQATLKENGYLIYNNITSRPNSLGKEIVVTSSYQNDVLTITWNFTQEDGTSPYGDGVQISAADLPANFNLAQCVMMFTGSGEQDIYYSVRSIEENHTAGYLASEARTNAFGAIEAKKAELAAAETISAFLSIDRTVDISALRLYEKVALNGWETEAYNTLLDNLIKKDQYSYEAISNYTGNTRNNGDGAYAEYANGVEYLVILNKFDTSNGGSSLLMQKKVDITDFEMVYKHQFIAQDTRISFQFADNLEAYNYNQLTFPGICIVTMYRDGNVYLMITNTNGVQNIEGVNVDQWHVLCGENGGWLGMPVAVGDALTFSLKADAENNIVITLKNGENSIGATITKAFFDAEKLDVTNLYFKMYSGDQGFASGDNKYTVMEVTSIRDAANDRAVANAEAFLASAGAVTDIAGAVELLESDISTNIVYIQEGETFGKVREAIVTLKNFVKTALTNLADEYATLAEALNDVSPENLTKEKVDAADAASIAYYQNVDYLVYLTDAEITAIGAKVFTADTLLARGKVCYAVNAYIAAVNAIETRADIATAKELRNAISTADMVYLSPDEKAVINKIIADADKIVSDKDATLPEDAPVDSGNGGNEGSNGGCGSSASGSALLALLALGGIAVIRRKR